MNRITQMIGVGLIAGLAVSTAAHAQGNGTPAAPGLLLNITISGTAVGQSDDSSNDNGKASVTKSSTKTVKFTQASIIADVESANSATPTKNARLVFDTGGGTVSVVDGDNTYDASSFLAITLDPNGTGVWSGTDSVNDDSGDESQKYTGKYLVTIMYKNGGGVDVFFAGVATETWSIGAPKSTGDSPASDSISFSFVGDGQVEGSNAVLTGTFKASGKGTL